MQSDLSIGDYPLTITAANIRPSYIAFGEVKVHCDTGEVTGLSENISEDAKQFWKHIEEYIIGK
jgi:hypothetical protein